MTVQGQIDASDQIGSAHLPPTTVSTKRASLEAMIAEINSAPQVFRPQSCGSALPGNMPARSTATVSRS